MALRRADRHSGRPMRTLIYKRTPSGDPDPKVGVFGNNNCMKTVRGRQFDAVIGIGGIGREPEMCGIAGKLTWVGIGPHKLFDNAAHPDCPRVTFDHFWYLGERGPSLREKYPALASRMYDKNVRVLMHSPSPSGMLGSGKISSLDRDVRKILRLAMSAPPSTPLTRRVSRSTTCVARPRHC
jgi:hypothetical protein